MRVNDPISDDVHELYYRAPTVKERSAYDASRFVRKGKKVINRTFETRLKFGLRILTGFKKGTFGIEGRAFSSDASDPAYREDWKALLETNAPDIVAELGRRVFEASENEGVEVEGADIEADEADIEGAGAQEDPLRAHSAA